MLFALILSLLESFIILKATNVLTLAELMVKGIWLVMLAMDILIRNLFCVAMVQSETRQGTFA